ncbi:glycoside hydrolase family 16 protein [Actinoplanes sp. DH11]|uniref:glycoside hydrolase family 16 protein n=1 Tax=Actinoplanes sp. DH11 TaxID=2857011 RepID=UPI001E3EF00A|nr:glycoside hydrolase family 16 protein [Actinoplanes sp. DH11]
MTALRLDFEDDFTGPGLRADLWVDHYLPHWTTPERSHARYDVDARGLRLRIDADQPDWRPEDAPLRVSNIQTGSHAGTHRHRPDGLKIRTPVPTSLLWAPSAGRVEVTVTASADENCMLAAWLVGTEHLSPRDSGEICLFEIDAAAVGPSSLRARCGIKAHHDDRLRTDMTEVEIPVPAGIAHTWAAEWGPDGTTITCEGETVRVLPQTPDYPLFLLIDLFEIGPPSGAYPKSARVHTVRGWSPSE